MKILLTTLFLIISYLGLAQFPSNVTALDVKANQIFTIKGNLEKGRIIEDLSWASNSAVACFPGTQNTKFRGHHVLYSMVLVSRAELTITVIPDNKNNNFSLYAYQIGTNNYSTVPNLSSCVSCEADHKWDYPKRGKTQDHTRSVYLNSIENQYNVVIGVVGAEGLSSGGFTLKIEMKSEESSTQEQEALKIYSALCEKGKTLSYTGDLSEGVVINDLSWASTSGMACFPATQNAKFRGKQIIYIVEMPTYAEMTIQVIPEKLFANFSVWAYQVSPSNTAMVPHISSCIACEADYKWDYPKAGKTQTHIRSVALSSLYAPYKVVIGVAGATLKDTGKFKLKISTFDAK